MYSTINVSDGYQVDCIVVVLVNNVLLAQMETSISWGGVTQDFSN